MPRKTKAKSRPRPRGPKPSITRGVVERVSERYGMGIPLQDALAAEANPKINLETWKKALAAHPELSLPYEAAKGKFLEWAMRKLKDADNLKFLCFLLRTRRSDLFAEKPVEVSVTNTITGVPDDVLWQMRAAARELARNGEKHER